MVTNVIKQMLFIFTLLLGTIFSQPVWGAEAENEITVTPLEVDGGRVTTSQLTLPLDGKVHQLTLSVTNFSNQKQSLNYQGVQGVTNAQGQLTYDTPKNFSGKVPLNFENLIPEASLTLSSGETQELTLSLDFQQVDYGEVTGAIRMASDTTSYFLPITLVGVTGVPKPQLAVTKISGQLLAKLPALAVTIENSAAKQVEAEPVKLNVIHSQFFGLVKRTWQVNLAQVTWAPNGSLKYPISMEGQALRSGSYQITGTLGQGDNQVQVNESFTLTRSQVAAINNQAPQVNDATLRWGIPVLIGLTVILLLVITVAIRQHKKQKRIRNKH